MKIMHMLSSINSVNSLLFFLCFRDHFLGIALGKGPRSPGPIHLQGEPGPGFPSDFSTKPPFQALSDSAFASVKAEIKCEIESRQSRSATYVTESSDSAIFMRKDWPPAY